MCERLHLWVYRVDLKPLWHRQTGSPTESGRATLASQPPSAHAALAPYAAPCIAAAHCSSILHQHPCRSTLHQHQQAAHHSDSTLKQHPAAAFCNNSKRTQHYQHPEAAPSTSTSRQQQASSKAHAPIERQHRQAAPLTPTAALKLQRYLSAAPCTGTLHRHQHARSKAHRPLWHQHLQAAALQSAHATVRAPPRSNLQQQWHARLQGHRCLHSDSGTVQRHQHTRSKAHAPLWHQRPQQHLPRHPAAAPACPLQSTQTTLTAGPCSGTKMPAPKRRHATPPVQEVRTQSIIWGKSIKKIGLPRKRSKDSGRKGILVKRQRKHQKNIVRRECVSSLGLQSCEQEGLSKMTRANPIKRKWHDQTRTPKEIHVKDKDSQEITTQAMAVTTRRSSFVPIGSSFFTSFPFPFQTSVIRLARGLLVSTKQLKIIFCGRYLRLAM